MWIVQKRPVMLQREVEYKALIPTNIIKNVELNEDERRARIVRCDSMRTLRSPYQKHECQNPCPTIGKPR